MDTINAAVAVSLTLLAILLAVLAARGVVQFRRTRVRSQLMWAGGLAFAAAAMAIEAVVYVGWVTEPLLQAYVFLSAAIVGVLSLGVTKVLRSPRLELGYTWFILVSCLIVAAASALTPLSSSMVVNGIIAGNPPALLIELSSIVTVPATVVLLVATAVSLRRSWRWQTLLMAAGAVILGAGGALYIASFPVALYYAEFLGIILLFLGILSLPSTAAAAAHAPAPSS